MDGEAKAKALMSRIGFRTEMKRKAAYRMRVASFDGSTTFFSLSSTWVVVGNREEELTSSFLAISSNSHDFRMANFDIPVPKELIEQRITPISHDPDAAAAMTLLMSWVSVGVYGVSQWYIESMYFVRVM